jgi:hypothetical protein
VIPGKAYSSSLQTRLYPKIVIASIRGSGHVLAGLACLHALADMLAIPYHGMFVGPIKFDFKGLCFLPYIVFCTSHLYKGKI